MKDRSKQLDAMEHEIKKAGGIKLVGSNSHLHKPIPVPENAPSIEDIHSVIDSCRWTVWDRLKIHSSLIELRRRNY